VEIYIDPVFPVPHLLLLGSSPVNEALARLGEAMGLSVRSGDAGGLSDHAEREPGTKLYVLVATMGESDEEALAAALAARPDYLGVIASRRRMEEIRARLAARGVADEEIATIHGPAGLDIGATRAEEIALSVLAEIVADHHRAPQRDPEPHADAEHEEPATVTEPGASPHCGCES
jgi:xanthine dehydrogenase accessory factor